AIAERPCAASPPAFCWLPAAASWSRATLSRDREGVGKEGVDALPGRAARRAIERRRALPEKGVGRLRVDDHIVRDLGVPELRPDEGHLLGSDERVLAAHDEKQLAALP